MGVVEQTSGAVESQLSSLENAYESFTVNQRTITVPAAEYERKRRHAENDEVEIYTKVSNSRSEVLHVKREGKPVLPSVTTSIDSGLEQAARSVVADETDVAVQIEGIDTVTILGLRDGSDDQRETVYTLAILFEAEPESEPTEDALWKRYESGTDQVFI